uniref:Uncharacterized protein n=1 Tax=Ciona intestinalis TaxID=7719 RepID=H2XSD6_CIOIN
MSFIMILLRVTYIKRPTSCYWRHLYLLAATKRYKIGWGKMVHVYIL